MQKVDELFTTDELESSSSDNEEENIINKCRVQKKKRLLLNSESDNESSISRRILVHNIFREMSGSTGYAKQHIIKGNEKTAFSLIIDHRIMEHIRIIGDKWDLNLTKLDAFIALLYACGAYEAKNLDISYLLNKE
ncbi:piggyBac transposable element-derived protein 4-like [Vespula squamosa]|uniref:PiggyBac transposable element-derived protein 4-like n=1 Tax=Vespula squamosa TaxID=30214 RepID=A0ABD2A3H7_VESSQ